MNLKSPIVNNFNSQNDNLRDLELLKSFLAGDNTSFGKLYSFYEKKVMFYCKHLTENDLVAQDVFQEIWIKIINLRTKSIKVECFKALLFTIARNTTLNHIGVKNGIVPELIYNYDVNLKATNSEYSETEELVNKALARLPFIQREAFLMHAILGYSFEEISKVQGVGLSAVKSRSARTRDFIRKLLSNWMALSEEVLD